MSGERACLSGCTKMSVDDTNGAKCGTGSCNKLNVHNWLEDVPYITSENEIIEVRFKNTRKAYYTIEGIQKLKKGDIIAVEASPGHDIGIVSLTGPLVNKQLKKNGISLKDTEFKKVYRKARPNDIDKWKEAMKLEVPTMLRARKIAEGLNLEMKIGDVEYQGDRTKAIFYYIAENRVDFRELIKVLADEFKVRIEMKQIGARQEAGRIGGVGPCGKELCCTSWMTNFVSVSTNSARYQELSLNPQKLAGQCAKLKCCLNFELSCYMDARANFPKTNIVLETADGSAYHQKTDIFKNMMWYSFDRNSSLNMTAISVDRVKEIIELNKKGEKVGNLVDFSKEPIEEKQPDFENVVGQESLTRFQDKNPKKKKKKKRYNKNWKPRNKKND